MEGSLNVIGYGLATIGPGLAVGMIFAALINGAARQPEAVGTLRPLAILGFVFAEVLAILGFVLAFVV